MLARLSWYIDRACAVQVNMYALRWCVPVIEQHSLEVSGFLQCCFSHFDCSFGSAIALRVRGRGGCVFESILCGKVLIFLACKL